MKNFALIAGALVLASLATVVGACGSSGGSTATDGDGGMIANDDGGGVDMTDGGGVTMTEGGGTDAAMPIGSPIAAPSDKWTWIDFPDAVCDDGTPTGIGLYPSSTSDKLLVFMNGGGACWDYETCVTLSTSTHGPYGAAQFAAVSGSPLTGSIFDRTNADNPFKDWNVVFVPYCTGDVHAGSIVQTYTSGTLSKTIHHEGHTNVLAYLARLQPTFKTASQIAVTGSSAGGGGALFNYDTFRNYWPTTPMFLVDDSLPLFEKDGISSTLRAAWTKSWNLAPIVAPICGTACDTDFSQFMKAIAAKYPNDRMALLESQQDATISEYFMLSGATFQTDLTALATDILDPTGNWKHFFIAGNSHTMLGNASTIMSQGTPLYTWLGQMQSGDAAWTSKSP